MKYVIQSTSEKGFWNNVCGWVHNIQLATQFSPLKNGLMPRFPLSKGKDAEWLPAEYDPE